jgi:plastocyanin
MTTVRSIRLAATATAVAGLVAMFTAVPAGAASKPPITFEQKVTFKGNKDVSKKSSATIDQELDDKYYEPTTIKAKPGEKLTFEIDNEGKLPHTFTSDVLDVDKEVQPGQSAKFTVTVPSSGTVFGFYCSFHEADGMVGAVYTKAGARVANSATTSGADLKPADPGGTAGGTGGTS